jgi:hypothetical protein
MLTAHMAINNKNKPIMIFNMLVSPEVFRSLSLSGKHETPNAHIEKSSYFAPGNAVGSPSDGSSESSSENLRKPPDNGP